MEAEWNTSTAILHVVRGDEKGSQCLGLWLGQPVLGGYKYRELAIQVGGVSSETVIYSYGAFTAVTSE
jgi:hypothetical protein